MKEGRADIKKEARQLEIYSFIFYFLSSLAFFIHRPSMMKKAMKEMKDKEIKNNVQRLERDVRKREDPPGQQE